MTWPRLWLHATVLALLLGVAAYCALMSVETPVVLTQVSPVPITVLPTLVPAPTLEATPTPRIVPDRVLRITTRLPSPSATPRATETPVPTMTSTRVPEQSPVQRGDLWAS